jgi:SAM-dependent methyltransferase
MGDYTNMSNYYDLIMQSGYYDYAKIADSLVKFAPFNNILEIGCGTGLILEQLTKRQPNVDIVGFDLTPAMLDIAGDRLASHPHIHLFQQNVTTLNLGQTFDLAFSYGGVWYFVVDGVNEAFMVSHIADDVPNHQGLERVAQHVVQGGRLLLGIQGPHHDYENPISNGMIYSQKIEVSPHGFIKHYYLADGDQRLMAQTIDYRTYSLTQALALLAEYGFIHEPSESDHQFMIFKKS